MAHRISQSTLNASTIDILNVIRQNASLEYQQLVPEVEKATDIPRVGEVLYGNTAMANQFLNQLTNRIALVAVNSAVFYNPYSDLKKGYLEYGETIEQIFVGIAKVVDYDPEKAEKREFKRTIPDVQAAYHVINWRVMYPVTINDMELKRAFLSMSGVQDLIARIVNQIYTAASYDEFLLFKYMLIKAISHGQVKPFALESGDGLTNAAVAFRGTSNLFDFMSNQYNVAGVQNTAPKERQVIFMDAVYNAQYDVEVLAAAFNMDKADFSGRLYLIDNWTTFDNTRFEVIRQNSDGLEDITEAELAIMANVKAAIFDREWFQFYDNLNKFTEKFVASGPYWNYFYHVHKTVSFSPFHNAVVFVDSAADVALPASIDVKITQKEISEQATVFVLMPDYEGAGLTQGQVRFVQTEALTEAGIAVQPYGALIIPASQTATAITLVGNLDGETYTAGETITTASAVGDVITITKG